MNTTCTTTPTIRPLALLLAATFVCSTAVAAADQNSARAQGQQYRQACMAGQTHQDRATCLKEANNYLADLKKNPAKYQTNLNADTEANAKLRCEPLSGSERTACMARAAGMGKVSGSVEGGGVYRELVTVEPVKPAEGGVSPAATAVDAPATK